MNPEGSPATLIYDGTLRFNKTLCYVVQSFHSTCGGEFKFVVRGGRIRFHNTRDQVRHEAII